jgi:hypothetical protein
LQGAISVEHQLPYRSVLTGTFTIAKSEHTLRQRNVNAPVCPDITVCPTLPLLTSAQIQPLRPDPTQGNIYQIESSGYAITKLVSVTFRTNFNPKISFNAGYTLSFADGDTDSLNSPRVSVNAVGFPAYSYNLNGEYAPSAFNTRHSIFIIGSASLPWGIRVSPRITWSSAPRFNITTGVDTNYDSIFAERPTFNELHNRCMQLGLTASYCDISGIDNADAVIPRNYGTGFDSFVTSVNFSKTIGFGGSRGSVAANGRGNQGGGGGGRNNRGGGGGGRGGAGGAGPVMMGGGGGGGFFGGGGGEGQKRYSLTFNVNVNNLFNTVNFSSPVGSLSSPSFGLSRSTGGGFGFFGGGGGGSANRRVDLSVRFNW